MSRSAKPKLSRRTFLSASVSTLAVGAICNVQAGTRTPPLTINQVIERIKEAIPLNPAGGTVDVIKAGDGSQIVSGIVTTMFATVDVIRQTAALRANFIIAHEPTFYNHTDETRWLEDHQVYQMKTALLEEHGIVVWRFHDYLHANNPDGIMMGVLTDLEWQNYADKKNPMIVHVPITPLHKLLAHLKQKLGIETLRYIGDLKQECRKIALLPGALGGRRHMAILHEHQPDVLICGEAPEWETSEYVRDAGALGLKRSLIALGHSVSEEPGMRWLVGWLQPKVPGVKITHLPSGNPFRFF